MDIKKHTQEVIEESSKFDGGLMGLTYCIYYYKDCEVDFAIKSSYDVICCPSCKSENLIQGDVQDFLLNSKITTYNKTLIYNTFQNPITV